MPSEASLASSLLRLRRLPKSPMKPASVAAQAYVSIARELVGRLEEGSLAETLDLKPDTRVTRCI